jgi:hypothetical protein
MIQYEKQQHLLILILKLFYPFAGGAPPKGGTGLGQTSPVLGRRGREKSQKEKGINTPYRKRYLISIKRD